MERWIKSQTFPLPFLDYTVFSCHIHKIRHHLKCRYVSGNCNTTPCKLFMEFSIVYLTLGFSTVKWVSNWWKMHEFISRVLSEKVMCKKLISKVKDILIFSNGKSIRLCSRLLHCMICNLFYHKLTLYIKPRNLFQLDCQWKENWGNKSQRQC